MNTLRLEGGDAPLQLSTTEACVTIGGSVSINLDDVRLDERHTMSARGGNETWGPKHYFAVSCLRNPATQDIYLSSRSGSVCCYSCDAPHGAVLQAQAAATPVMWPQGQIPAPLHGSFSPEADLLFFGQKAHDFCERLCEKLVTLEFDMPTPHMNFVLSNCVTDNAFWSRKAQAVFVSRGSQSKHAYPLPDIIGHEVCHSLYAPPPPNFAPAPDSVSEAFSEAVCDMLAEAFKFRLFGFSDFRMAAGVTRGSTAPLRMMHASETNNDRAEQRSHLSIAKTKYYNSGPLSLVYTNVARKPSFDPEVALLPFLVAYLRVVASTDPNQFYKNVAHAVIAAAEDLGYSAADVGEIRAAFQQLDV
eukprot:m.166396 g.166396  ORF g.166396 m.166396 type:complete len:360 (-) comp21104_c0_seq2:56-1135(-)